MLNTIRELLQKCLKRISIGLKVKLRFATFAVILRDRRADNADGPPFLALTSFVANGQIFVK